MSEVFWNLFAALMLISAVVAFILIFIDMMK